MGNAVTHWFGDAFASLHPKLQNLHLHGGKLTGEVDLEVNKSYLGRRIAEKLGLPLKSGTHPFQVEISHENGVLNWKRSFSAKHQMVSVFKPCGSYPTGYWVESTGMVELHLGVEINNGGWYWQQRKAKIKGLYIPLWLFPNSVAYKYVQDESYVFCVEISVPLIGTLVKYSGTLNIE